MRTAGWRTWLKKAAYLCRDMYVWHGDTNNENCSYCHRIAKALHRAYASGFRNGRAWTIR